jgi:hypothetical protein
MTKIVYGKQAYEGFARAIGSKLGLQVTIADGASPCIDANGVVRLPGMNTYQTAEEFTNTCAAIVHELAHQFYGSHGQIDPKRSRLEHDCLNAVLDVADEGGIARYFAGHGNQRPSDLLDHANQHALNYTPAFYDWQVENHAWKVLVTGILDSRLPRNGRLTRIKRYNARQAGTRGVDAKKCWRVIRRARIGKVDNGAPSGKRFPRLIKLAKELADLLLPFAPPDTQAPTPTPLDGALASGSATMPSGSSEATAADGADIADGKAACGASNGGCDAGGNFHACESAYRLLFPAVERIGQRIATDGDGITLLDSLASGPVLGQAYRLATDGQCLARWQTSEHADGVAVAVVLDCSGSMRYRLRECAGIARAFAVGMRECGPVLCLAFGSVCERSDDFETVRNLGGTNTHTAIADARDWLAMQPGARWIVLITDGQPGSPYEVERECAAARADRVRILAIGLNCELAMPADSIVTASDTGHLAIELQAAASLIER